MADENQLSRLAVQKIYIKDLSFESPNSPAIFMQSGKPDIDIQMHTAAKTVDKEVHEVVLTITVSAKSEDKTLFLVEIQQAGIFAIQNVEQEQLAPVLGIDCPSILFPYARQMISELTTQGGFPPLLMAPVNFDAVFRQHVEQQTEQPDGVTH